MGRKMALAGAAAAVVAVMAGCNRQAGTATAEGLGSSGGKYCTPFPSAAAATNSAGLAPTQINDPAASFDDCIHRWGYVLAPSRDPADVVAQASVEACSTILASWSQQLGQSEQPQTVSTRRGRESMAQQQPDPAAQRIHAAEGRALFYVVQARAGGCAAPPANTLVTPSISTG
ncbi:MAG TPA: hypothetical protein VMT68_16335 [Caulobacteraceae bacterium]|nr:hypothetical protein [Caulobacteraceae bacterium]